MKTLQVIKGKQVWEVKQSDGETMTLFGTDTLPTPWFISMPITEVVARLRELNPNTVINTRD